MILGMTLLTCPSSLNLIEANVLNHLNQGVDIIVCAVDKPTPELELKLKILKNIFYLRFYYTLYPEGLNLEKNIENHTVIMNCLIKELIEKGADWIINCDDDEFYIDNNYSLKDSILSYNEKDTDIVYPHGFNYYQTELDDQTKDIIPLKMLYRDNLSVYGYQKAIFRTKQFKSTTPGNHFIEFNKPKPIVEKTNKINIHHYTFRDKINVITGILDKNTQNKDQISKKELIYDTTVRDRLILLIK